MPAEAVICDVCGHDRSLESRQPVTAPPSMTVDMTPGTASPASPKRTRVAPQQAGKKGGKSGKGAASAVLFTTPQWIAITVASFILGAVLAASMLPSGGTTAAGNGEAAQQQGAQPDLQRLNSAREAAEANPDNPDALLAYANALHDADMNDQAIVQYKRYLEFVPDNPDARVDLGICYFEKKDYAAAIAEMEIAVAKHPDHQLGNYNLGIVNLNAGNKDKAREWFEKARDLDPTSPHGINAAQLLKEQF